MTPVLDIQNLVKHYGRFIAVDDLSFQVFPGEIFGLLGPNGAGKTTTIRIIMDIFRPDRGTVRVLGEEPSRARLRVGYLPEERGLYRDERVRNVLVYLARLKGIDRKTAQARADFWLEKVELAGRANSKIRDLSRGMQQKVQFIASLIHDPDLMILDEPFQGLDPVNVGLLKRLVRELQAEGKTIVLSSHQLNLVEELCDRIVLIRNGKAILYGELDQIKRKHSPDTLEIRAYAPLSPVVTSVLEGYAHLESKNGRYQLTLHQGTAQDILRTLLEHDVQLDLFQVATATLEEIFIEAVQKQDTDDGDVIEPGAVGSDPGASSVELSARERTNDG